MNLATSALIFILSALVLGSCGNGVTEAYEKQLDTLTIMLKHADENMALDPEILQLRVDTMLAKLFVIDSVFPVIGQRGDEVAMAYNVYRSALTVFKEYLDVFDAYTFENQSLQKELIDLKQGLKTKGGIELEELQKKIPEFRLRCYANYTKTKTLIRRYLDIIRPYQRKKKVIDHMFLKLVENNSIP